ncbi:exodeoxyribonuclease 7 large subunit [Bacteroidia bacterium]|nr:exodeoxyribonuclease 7 large subunit [Bacteroidia bacterium]GHV21226.1 exodeoxyribonuclease 7 large subunit [Bacteroidia bacterium]
MNRNFLTLSELNLLVEERIKESFSETYWVMAETSDVRLNQSSGHCYLEFIEKSSRTSSITAKARGYIWNNTFRVLKPYFEEVTGQQFTSGLKILVRVSVEFHPVYGYGLNVVDIEPAYTLGDMQLRKKKIIAQLEEDGVFTLNKELLLPLNPQRIAIITSPSAAGYEDFLEHLNNNIYGFVFYPKLFSAVMQGEQTEMSVFTALEKIYNCHEFFDVLVIIRGGGATSDLMAFDSYQLAAACAQFPIPVITGIGHERDDTVVDLVAYHRAKTPTAVADYLVQCILNTYNEFLATEDAIKSESKKMLGRLNSDLKMLTGNLRLKSLSMIEKQSSVQELYRLRLRNVVSAFTARKQYLLSEKESFVKLMSPEYILAKGYSITRVGGKTIKSPEEVSPGDKIETTLSGGFVVSIICN